MNDHDAYAFELDREKLELYKRLTPEERFLWLEGSYDFVANTVSADKIKKWKQYLNRQTNRDIKNRTSSER